MTHGEEITIGGGESFARDIDKLKKAVFEGNGEPSLRSQMAVNNKAIKDLEEQGEKMQDTVQKIDDRINKIMWSTLCGAIGIIVMAGVEVLKIVLGK